MSDHLFIVLGGGALSLVVMLALLFVHELRESRRQAAREEREIQRHDAVLKEVRDMRALALAAITQRTALDGDVRDLREVVADHADRLDRLAPGPARRPKP